MSTIGAYLGCGQGCCAPGNHAQELAGDWVIINNSRRLLLTGIVQTATGIEERYVKMTTILFRLNELKIHTV